MERKNKRSDNFSSSKKFWKGEGGGRKVRKATRGDFLASDQAISLPFFDSCTKGEERKRRITGRGQRNGEIEAENS